MFYNLVNNQKSTPFENLNEALAAGHDLCLSLFDNGLNSEVYTVAEDGHVITEFRVIEVIH